MTRQSLSKTFCLGLVPPSQPRSHEQFRAGIENLCFLWVFFYFYVLGREGQGIWAFENKYITPSGWQHGHCPCLSNSGKKKQHKHKLFGPDFPRTFLTLAPGRPWAKKFLPITGPQTNALFGADVHDFWRGRPWPEGFLKNFVQKKFALIFWPLQMVNALRFEAIGASPYRQTRFRGRCGMKTSTFSVSPWHMLWHFQPRIAIPNCDPGLC